MHSFAEALGLLHSQVRTAEVERCRIEQAGGRVLRVAVHADRALPPYDRVMMDGYALRRRDWDDGRRVFDVAGSAPAGAAAAVLPGRSGVCLEVMTGAPCPLGADAIVPVEEVAGPAEAAGQVRFAEGADPQPGRFIHAAGSDVAAGAELLAAGTVLGSREIGVAASCGAAWLEVSAQPVIAVVATGDELVAVDAQPAAHQIRQSNAHALAAALAAAGFPASRVMACGDDAARAEADLAGVLAGHEWVIFTGAVSKGRRDFLPALLEKLGYRRLFHGVAQRPGKPAGCWVGRDQRLVIALPGNPVSALTGLHAFVLPALELASARHLKSPVRHRLDDPAAGLPGFTLHLPVVLSGGGGAVAAPTGNSGDFIGLLKSDGFLTIPPLADRQAGASLPFTRWR